MTSNIKVEEFDQNFMSIIWQEAETECLHYFCWSCIAKYRKISSEYKFPNFEGLTHEKTLGICSEKIKNWNILFINWFQA